MNVMAQHGADQEGAESLNHTIFEGTSEIQQLVISRAISGLRIE
jgi:alkylation response protein AidB-like acyl-CoA dehydrogenase